LGKKVKKMKKERMSGHIQGLIARWSKFYSCGKIVPNHFSHQVFPVKGTPLSFVKFLNSSI